MNLRRITDSEVVLFSVASQRPRRINQGCGGAVAQLQAISEQLTDKGKQKGLKNSFLADTPANAMAPVKVGRKTQAVSR